MKKLLDGIALTLVWGGGSLLTLLLFILAWRVGGLGPLLTMLTILGTLVWAVQRVRGMREGH
jgi:hypothetical protein